MKIIISVEAALVTVGGAIHFQLLGTWRRLVILFRVEQVSVVVDVVLISYDGG